MEKIASGPDEQLIRLSPPSPDLAQGWASLALLLAWTTLLATLMALLEIQIEGAQGWAAGLPTWRITDASHLRWLFGDREVTGYHTFLFSFMGAVFHLPLVMRGRFSWRLETRILGSLMIFWILEDLLWFVLNPAYGLSLLTPQHAPWHPHWWFGIPSDYFVFMILGSLLLGWSYRTMNTGDPR